MGDKEKKKCWFRHHWGDWHYYISPCIDDIRQKMYGPLIVMLRKQRKCRKCGGIQNGLWNKNA